MRIVGMVDRSQRSRQVGVAASRAVEHTARLRAGLSRNIYCLTEASQPWMRCTVFAAGRPGERKPDAARTAASACRFANCAAPEDRPC